jgi:hypothetical protein
VARVKLLNLGRLLDEGGSHHQPYNMMIPCTGVQHTTGMGTSSRPHALFPLLLSAVVSCAPQMSAARQQLTCVTSTMQEPC